MNSSQITSLLQETRIQLVALQKSEERFSHKLAPDFLMFDAFRFDEMTLSRCIGDLLNPKGSHAQGALFLDAFLERLGLKECIGHTQKARVSVERVLRDGRRIDLLLEIDGYNIGIENKPWAGYAAEQLADYLHELERISNDGNYTLVCLDNKEPPKHAIDLEASNNHRNLGHFKHMDFYQLEDWLRETAPHAHALPVRIYVEELSKYVRHHINGALDMSELQEIDTILKDRDSLEPAMAIIHAWPEIRKRKLREFKNELQNLWRSKWQSYSDAKVLWDEKMDKESGECWFGFSLNNGQSLIPCFAFEGAGLNNLYWGVSTMKGEIPSGDTGTSKIHGLMNTEFGFEGKSNKWWAWWSYADRPPLDRQFKDWSVSPEPWILMEDGKLAGEFVDVASRIQETLQEQPGLTQTEVSG